MEAFGAPIFQYWHGPDPPEDVAGLIASFADRNPGVPHLVFDEASAERFIASNFTSREVAAFRACAVPAMQADYLRYCAVLSGAGVYADADLRCVAPLDSLLAPGQEGVMFGWPELPPKWQTPFHEWRERVGPYRAVLNHFFAFRSRGHPLLAMTLEAATVNIEQRISDDVATATGPSIFTSLYLLHRLGSFDAFLEYSRGGAIERSAPLLCEVVDDYERIPAAFDGVRIDHMRESHAWTAFPDPPPAYKRTEHWSDLRTGIYR